MLPTIDEVVPQLNQIAVTIAGATESRSAGAGDVHQMHILLVEIDPDVGAEVRLTLEQIGRASCRERV